MRRLGSAALVSLGLCAPVHAEEPFIGGVVKESDVAMLFAYLREAMSAGFRGREAAPPEAVVKRADAIAEQAKRHAEVAAQAALDAIEREIRDSVRAHPRERLPGSI